MPQESKNAVAPLETPAWNARKIEKPAEVSCVPGFLVEQRAQRLGIARVAGTPGITPRKSLDRAAAAFFSALKDPHRAGDDETLGTRERSAQFPRQLFGSPRVVAKIT